MSIRKRTWTAKKRGADGDVQEVERIAWVVDYKDQKSNRRLKTFKTKGAAKDWWQGQAAPEIMRGTHTPESASVRLRKPGSAGSPRPGMTASSDPA